MFKNITFIFILFLFLGSLAYAEPASILFENFSSANNSGVSKKGKAKDHGVFCNYTNIGGSATALIINLEGSIDNENFEVFATKTFTASELTNRSALFFAIDYPVASVLANISSVTDTGSTYVGCKYKAHRTPNR